MARPVVPALAEYLYDELGDTQPQDETLGWPFLILLAGLATTAGELPDIVRDSPEGDPGWTVLFDPVRCPVWALAWLAQFAGVALTGGAGEALQRAQITSPPAFRRGTPEAMKDAVRLTLSGVDPTVIITERNGSPRRIAVTTHTAQTPDPAATLAAAKSQKPAGLILTANVVDGWSIGEMEAAYAGRTIADLESDFTTIADLEAGP